MCFISLDVLRKVRIIVMFNFLKYSTHPAVLEVLTRVCTLGQTFHIIYMYLEYSNNLKRLFDSLCAITGESSFISMLSFTFERCYKTLKQNLSYYVNTSSYWSRMSLQQIKTMVALVYVKTTTTYTSIVMSDTYVACWTKWRLLTCAYWLPQMLDTYSWVDLSIWHKVNSLVSDQYSNAILYCLLLLTYIDFCKDVCSLMKFSFFLIVSLNWMQWKF